MEKFKKRKVVNSVYKRSNMDASRVCESLLTVVCGIKVCMTVRRQMEVTEKVRIVYLKATLLNR